MQTYRNVATVLFYSLPPHPLPPFMSALSLSCPSCVQTVIRYMDCPKPHSVSKEFKDYRMLHQSLSDSGVPVASAPAPAFPATHKMIAVGRGMTEEELLARAKGLHAWFRSVAINYSEYPQQAQVSSYGDDGEVM